MRLSRAILPLLTLFLLVIPDAAAQPLKTRKIVLIAGEKDGGHPKGTHEYELSVRLLEQCLKTSGVKGLRIESHYRGWPRDERTLDDADTIVVISSGADRREQDHPLLVADRLQVLDKQMKRGCGLVTIHWTTFFPNEKAGEKILEWVGGYFDYQSGPPPRNWYSAIQTVKTNVKPGTPDHPVCRGLSPFELREEFYYKIRFRAKDERLKPILQAEIPGEKQAQTVAWAVERKDGRRGFGFTGGHFFDNWYVPGFRKMVLNAIVWTAKAEVPQNGVTAEPPKLDALQKQASPPPMPGTLSLVEGKFGKALDARATPVIVEGNERFRTPPLTVECWARLNSRQHFNVLVASDYRSSALHWELYTCAGSGSLSAYLPGMSPAEIRSKSDVCDGRWHYLAMTHDGQTVKLFVDGKLAHEQKVKKRAGAIPEPGPLTIGLALQGEDRIGCDGLIDDVRISSIARAIHGIPKEGLPLDLNTIGQWRFDIEEAGDVDPAWTPRPAEGDAPAWEKMTDKDWIDGRFQQTDTGPYLNATFKYPVPGGQAMAYKGTAIRVGDRGEAAVLFDRCQLRLAAGWTGKYLTHSSRRFGLLNTPTPAGTMTFATRPGPGWADARGAWNSATPSTVPLPSEWAHFQGLHLQGKRVVLSYTVGTTAIKESPWAESRNALTALSRNLEIAGSGNTLTMRAGELPGQVFAQTIQGAFVCSRLGEEAWAIALVGNDRNVTLHPGDGGTVNLTIKPRKIACAVKLLLWHGNIQELPAFLALVSKSAPPALLADLEKPGPTRWKPLTTRGEVGKSEGPFAVDTLTIPYENPYRALFFVSGVDFMPNGDVAVCTAHGDVWLVSGADDRLDRLTWRRYATGLYQPLGLKVVDGKIVVLERGQLTRLHDLNNDGEADFYENVNNDWYCGGGEHSFDTCLEVDPKGNFYFFKTGDTETPTGGCLLRVSKDGKQMEIFATGFRHPIGLGMSPGGVVSGADQEGNWMPMTRIDLYRKGGFYGDMRAHHRKTPPDIYDPPLCWLPKQMDNSAGGQVWVPDGQWGPLANMMLHLSYGRCRMMLVLPQKAGDVDQGGAVDLGLQFLSGVARGRFHPKDGHLYLAGLNGWQTAAVRDGCLQRVRYTGKPVREPVGLAVHENGVKLTFSEKLNPTQAADLKRYHVEQWNYHWSADYGSKRWSVKRPNEVSQDRVSIKSARLLPDGKSVFLELDGVRPVMQMEIRYGLTTADGASMSGTLYNTIHKPAPGMTR